MDVKTNDKSLRNNCKTYDSLIKKYRYHLYFPRYDITFITTSLVKCLFWRLFRNKIARFINTIIVLLTLQSLPILKRGEGLREAQSL